MYHVGSTKEHNYKILEEIRNPYNTKSIYRVKPLKYNSIEYKKKVQDFPPQRNITSESCRESIKIRDTYCTIIRRVKQHFLVQAIRTKCVQFLWCNTRTRAHTQSIKYLSCWRCISSRVLSLFSIYGLNTHKLSIRYRNNLKKYTL